MARSLKHSGTVASGETETITLNMLAWDDGFQVSVEGAGTVAVATLESGNAAYVDQTTISEGSLIFDLQRVNAIQLTAAGGDMDYVVLIRSQAASTPNDSWLTFKSDQ